MYDKTYHFLMPYKSQGTESRHTHALTEPSNY